MMKVEKMLKTGIINRKEDIVTPENSAKKAGSGLLEVYATPSMIALMEGCSHEGIAAELDEGQGTVGISLNIEHVAATPVGMKVYCESELVDIDGRILTFDVKAYDECGLIGRGIHKRCIINNDKFLKKVEAKLDR